MRRRGAPLVAACALALASSGLAAYPERAVKLIVPWPPGGDTDAIVRPFAAGLGKHLGRSVTVTNVGGATGTAGAHEAKTAPPDGYTLLAVNDAIHAAYYTGIGDVGPRDFEPVCAFASTPSVLAARSGARWSSVREVLDDARGRPAGITVGVTSRADSRFFPALIERAAGVRFKYVTYEGIAPRTRALVGGQIDLIESDFSQRATVHGRHLEFLAVASERRMIQAPDVPTLRESGVDVVFAVTRGVMAPKRTPADVIASLEAACAKAVAEPTFADAVARLGTVPAYLDGRAYAERLRQQDETVRRLARELGLLKRS